MSEKRDMKFVERIKQNNAITTTPSQAIKFLLDDENFNKRHEELYKTVFNILPSELGFSDWEKDKDKVIEYILNKLVEIDKWKLVEIDKWKVLPKRYFSECFDSSALNMIVTLEYRKMGTRYPFDEIFFFTANGGYYTINLTTGSISKDELIDKAKKDDTLKSVFCFIKEQIELCEVSERWRCWHDDSDEYIFIDSEYRKDMAADFFGQYEKLLESLKSNVDCNKDNIYHRAFETCSESFLENEIAGFEVFFKSRRKGPVKNLFDPKKETDNRILAIKICFILRLNFEQTNTFLKACGLRAINNRRCLYDNIYEYCLIRKEPYSTFETLLNDYESSNYSPSNPEPPTTSDSSVIWGNPDEPGNSGMTTVILDGKFFSATEKGTEEFLNDYLLLNRQRFINNSYRIRRNHDALRAKTAINHIVDIFERFCEGYCCNMEDEESFPEDEESFPEDEESFPEDTKSIVYEINKIFDSVIAEDFLKSIEDISSTGGENFEKYGELHTIIEEELKPCFMNYFSSYEYKDDIYNDIEKSEVKIDYSKKERASDRETIMFNCYEHAASEEINKLIPVIRKMTHCLQGIEVFSESKWDVISHALLSLEKLHHMKSNAQETADELSKSIEEVIATVDNKKTELRDKCQKYIKDKNEDSYFSLMKYLLWLRSLYFEKLKDVTEKIGHLISSDRIITHIVPIRYSERTKKNHYKASPLVKISDSSLKNDVLKNIPRSEYLNNFERGAINTFSESTRKALILMFFFANVMNRNESDTDNENCTNKYFDDFYNRLNDLLLSCNLTPMDSEWDRFDWLILKSIYLYGNAQTEEDYLKAANFIRDVIELSF